MRSLMQKAMDWYRRHAFAIAWVITAAVVGLLLTPNPPGAPVQVLPGLDKVVHVVMFAVLAGAWRVALVPGRSAWLAAAITIAVGLLTELAQHALPGRTASLADGLADLVGVGLGMALVRGWQRCRRPADLGSPGLQSER